MQYRKKSPLIHERKNSSYLPFVVKMWKRRESYYEPLVFYPLCWNPGWKEGSGGMVFLRHHIFEVNNRKTLTLRVLRLTRNVFTTDVLILWADVWPAHHIRYTLFYTNDIIIEYNIHKVGSKIPFLFCPQRQWEWNLVTNTYKSESDFSIATFSGLQLA